MSGSRELTSAGLSVKSLDEIRDDYETAVHGSSQFGEECPVGPTSVVGQVIDTHANQEVELDELQQAVYDEWDPDNAQGVQADNIAGLTLVTRKAGTKSTITFTLHGDASTNIPANSRCRLEGGTVEWETTEAATIGGGGTVDAPGQCKEVGPNEAASGSEWVIIDAVSGWDSVSNSADADPGKNIETTTEMMLRREGSVSIAGNCTDPALRAKLEALTDVQHATVISNRSDEEDSYGIPAHWFRCVIWPSTADAEAIVEVIWKAIACGGSPDGSEEYDVTDDQGYTQRIRFDWATELELYLVAEVTKGSSYPAAGDDLVKAALVAYGNSLRPGDDVLPDMFEAVVQLGSPALDIDPVPGVRAITVKAKFGSTPGSGDTVPLTVALTEISTSDTSHTTVNSS